MLPARLVVGCDSPRSARMKQTEATRYSSAARSAFMIVRSPYFFYLNMDSMRCVTMKPPTLFTEGSLTARKPMRSVNPNSARSAAMSVVTMISNERAEGVASSGKWQIDRAAGRERGIRVRGIKGGDEKTENKKVNQD